MKIARISYQVALELERQKSATAPTAENWEGLRRGVGHGREAQCPPERLVCLCQNTHNLKVSQTGDRGFKSRTTQHLLTDRLSNATLSAQRRRHLSTPAEAWNG